jgi:carboxypeptidase Q
MRADGLDVHLEAVNVFHWQRGHESLVHVNSEKGERQIRLTTLGRSAASPPKGVEADVVVVKTFNELASLGADRLCGKIVLYNEAWTGYGGTVSYRSKGAIEAEKYGAVAVLVASVTPEASLDSLHTGLSNTASIPAAAITRREASHFEELYRLSVENPAKYKAPRLRFSTESHMDPEFKVGYNIVAQVSGREAPEKVVIMGGHIDS